MVFCSTPFHSSYTFAEACNMTVDLAVQNLTALQVAIRVGDDGSVRVSLSSHLDIR